MSFYQKNSYTDLIRQSMDARRGEGLTFQNLAAVAGIQKSYLSKVLHGRAHLNGDQLFALADFFGWTEDETHFAHLLLERDRTGLEKRRVKLTKQIEKIQRDELETSRHIEAEAPELSPEKRQEFYLDPWLQILHVAISVPAFAASSEKLARALRLDRKFVERALHALVRLGMAEPKGKGFAQKHSQLHLDRKVPYYGAWRNQIRMQSLQRLQTQGEEQDYSFSVTFSADEPTRLWLRQEFLQLLTRAEKKIQPSPSEGVFQLNFDLFAWSR